MDSITKMKKGFGLFLDGLIENTEELIIADTHVRDVVDFRMEELKDYLEQAEMRYHLPHEELRGLKEKYESLKEKVK